MHTVCKVDADKWEVGQEATWYQQGTPYEVWNVVETFDNKREAYALCNYLNGGNGDSFPQPPVTRKDGE